MNDYRRDLVSGAETFASEVSALIEGSRCGPSVEPIVERVRDQARRVAETVREPYKVGVIGEYGAGKTLFVASILGIFEDLPIGDLATTGNVTRFRLRPVPTGTRSQVTGRRVVFLSRGECDDGLADLARQIRESPFAPRGPELDAPVRRALERDPDELWTWHKNAQRAPGDFDSSLDRLVGQLVAVSASARDYPGHLGVTRDVTRDEFTDLVQIAYDGRVVGDRPPSHPFWLIRQAEMFVDVPDAVGLRLKEELELWDFPGILNLVSSERDRRLTQVLLEDVDTAVVLLKATNPDSPAPDELRRLLKVVGGRAIAGIGNIFDSPEAVRLREAGRWDTDEAVLAALPSTAAMLRTAQKLTPREPTFLYAGLVALNERDPELVARHFDERATNQYALALHAREVARALPETSPLRAMLLPAAEDGGRARVIAMIGDQLAKHGPQRRADRVAAEDRRLRDLLKSLETAVERAPDSGGVSPARVEYQFALKGLGITLTRVRNSLPVSLASTLTDTSFAQYVEEASAKAIHRWPHWRRMLGSVRGRSVSDGPMSTDELIEPFAQSCAAAFDGVRAEAQRRWEDALLETAERLLVADRDLRKRAEAVHAEQGGSWIRLARPDTWRGMLTRPEPAVLDRLPYHPPGPSRYAEAFPLRRGSRFGWSYAPGHRAGDDAELLHRRHPGSVIRMRHELTATASYLLQSDVDDLRAWAFRVIADYLRRLGKLASMAAEEPIADPDGQERGDLLAAIRELRDKPAPNDAGNAYEGLPE